MEHVGIAGAGLVGRLMAWRLLREGCRVTLFDKNDRHSWDNAGLTAAAMLAPYSEVVRGERIVFDLGQDSLARWPRWLAELEADTGMAVFYRREGSLIVAHPRDEADLRRFERHLHHAVTPGPDEVRRVDESELGRLEPQLAGRFPHGLFIRDEGQLANDQLFEALERALDRLGCEWQDGVEVTRVEPHRLVTAEGTRAFDRVVDARGLGLREQDQRLRGVRGEVLWVEAPEVSLNRPVRLMHPRYQLYIAPRPGNLYIIGATEIESDDLGPMTVRSGLELMSALYSVHPGFGEGRVVRTQVHCRPAYMDNLPRIELESGLVRVNGFYRHGYLVAPAMVEQAVALLGGLPIGEASYLELVHGTT